MVIVITSVDSNFTDILREKKINEEVTDGAQSFYSCPWSFDILKLGNIVASLTAKCLDLDVGPL